jgi:light-harvesting complex 1 beta chain
MNGETAMNDMSYSPKPSRRDDKLTLVLIFAPCFVLLLSIALLGQLVGLHWQNWLPGAEQKNSLFSGVHAAVYTLMSHII